MPHAGRIAAAVGLALALAPATSAASRRSALRIALGPISPGPELVTDAPVLSPSPGRQVAVAGGSPYHLAAWIDGRQRTRETLTAARIDSAGVLVDPVGFQVAPLEVAYAVGAGSNGSGFLVAWAASSAGSDRIFAARVAIDGTVLDSPPLDLGPSDSMSTPTVAWGGGHWLVVWDAWGSADRDIFGVRIDPDGTVLDASPLALASPTGDDTQPHVAFGASAFLVVFTNTVALNNDLAAVRVRPDGLVLDATPISVAATAESDEDPGVAYCGGTFVVAWEWMGAGTNGDLRATRVSDAGAVDPAPFEVANGPFRQDDAAIAAVGLKCQATWMGDALGDLDIWSATLDPSGATLASTTPAAIASAPRDQATAVIAAAQTSGSVVVAWNDDRMGIPDELYAIPVRTIFGGSGQPVPGPFSLASGAVSQSANAERRPAVASDGSSYLLAWDDLRGPQSGVYAMRFDGGGTPLDPSPILVSAPNAAASQPAVGFDGTDYVIVWADERNSRTVFGARLSPSGTLRDPGGFEIGGGWFPGIGCGGGQCLVSSVDDIGVQRVLVGRVKAGVPLDPGGIPISQGAPAGPGGNVACDGAGFCWVAWADAGPAGTADPDILAVRVDANGTVLDANPVVVCDAPGWQEVPAVGFDGERWIAVWHDHRNGPAGEIYASRLDRAGAVLDGTGFPLGTSGWDQDLPTVVYDGTQWIVAWADQASGGWDIQAARVSLDGVVMDPGGLNVVSTPTYDFWPRLAFRGPGELFIGYEEYDDSPAVGAMRVKARLVYTAQGGGACATTSDCEYGLYCVNNVCCGVACAGGCQVCSAAAGATVNGRCTTAPAARECRSAVDVCDVPEYCDGTSPGCPADRLAPAATLCRGAAGPCDVAEACDGVLPACPADGFAPASQECRPSAGPCDPAEHCSGTGAACPADAIAPAGTECRASRGPCDPAETCTGAGTACPPDLLAPASQTCRPAAGACDVDERCDGANPACPPDILVDAGTACRARICANGEVTEAASCDGSLPVCPAPQVTSCFPYGCSGDQCASGCQLDSDCGKGARCEAPACIPSSPDGASCAADRQCLSGHCLAGLCCESTCTGSCEACDLPGQQGKCRPRPSGAPGSPACPGSIRCTGMSGACGCRGDADCFAGQTCVGGLCRVPAADPGTGLGCHCGFGRTPGSVLLLALLALGLRRRARVRSS